MAWRFFHSEPPLVTTGVIFPLAQICTVLRVPYPRLFRRILRHSSYSRAQVRHTEFKDVTQKEMALRPFAQAYYAAVRNGLCNAYLAASVVCSSWVCTSKTGHMGKVRALDAQSRSVYYIRKTVRSRVSVKTAAPVFKSNAQLSFRPLAPPPSRRERF